MENGKIEKRDLKGPQVKKMSAWWPLFSVYTIIVCSLWVIVVALQKFFVSMFKEKKSINGKIILITGSGRGLGRQLAMDLAKLGAHIACVDINKSNNDETAELIRKEGGSAQSFTCNIAKVEQIEQMKRDVTTKMGPVDIVINNAALVMAMSLKSMKYEDIRAIFEVNLMGPVCVSRAFLGDMMERNEGHIVTVSSMSAYMSYPFITAYSASKAGLTRFFDCTAVELNYDKSNNIKITTVHPLLINTSADYMSWLHSFIPAMEMSYVSREIIEAIQYEKESVTVPSYCSVAKITDALFGRYQYNCLLDVSKFKINIPSKDIIQQLPYSSIVADTVKIPT